MDNRIRAACTYIKEHEKEMLGLLQELTQLESHWGCPDGVARVAERIDREFKEMKLERKLYTFKGAGPTLTAWTASTEKPAVALIGHMDTVHPAGSFGKETFVVKGDCAYGPGIFDMKGGLVIELFAVKALLAAGYSDRQIRFVFTGDEEVAHTVTKGQSGEIAREYAKGCCAAFNGEFGEPDGEVTVKRKGAVVYNIEIHGKAAHSGRNPELGASAIRQAAGMVTAIENLSSRDGILYNCGQISGGTGSNIIPDYCKLNVSARFFTNQQGKEVEELIRRLSTEVTVPGTWCTVEQDGFYPAMEATEQTDALLDIYAKACSLFGEPAPHGIAQGGCSDSAFFTMEGVPTLCTVGALGDGAHMKDEHIQISSLVRQCQKLAASILLMPEDFK